MQKASVIVRVGRPGPARALRPGPATHFGNFYVGVWRTFTFFLWITKPFVQRVSQVVAPFRHFRFNILLSRFWLIAGVRSKWQQWLLSIRGAVQPQQEHTGPRQGWLEEKTCFFVDHWAARRRRPAEKKCIFEPPVFLGGGNTSGRRAGPGLSGPGRARAVDRPG